MIPIKDAAILTNCPYPAIRRVWVQRIIDHDGTADGQGGIEDWLRFAEDAYVTFARTRSWIEAVAASLTELFAPGLMQERIAAFERHYTWVAPAGLTYLKTRLTQAPRDAAYALDLVTRYCQTLEQQQRAIAALEFQCDVLWSMLDAIHHALQGESHDA